MKKFLQFLICVMPLLLLGTLYICILGFHMSDGNIWGMLMIMISAVLSVLTPTIGLLTDYSESHASETAASLYAASFLELYIGWRVTLILAIGSINSSRLEGDRRCDKRPQGWMLST